MSTFTDQNTHPSSQDLDQSNFLEQKSSETDNFKQLESQFLPSNILQILSEQNRPAIQAEQLDEYFKNLSFFDKLRSEGGSQINDLLLHEVWRNVEFAQLEANTLIFKEKEPSNNKMFIILKGKVGINIKPLQEELFNQGNEKNEQPTKLQKVNSKPKENNQQNDQQAERKNSQQNADGNDNENNRNQSYQVSNQNNFTKQNEASTPQKHNQTTFRLDQQHIDENQQMDQSDSDSDQENQQSEQQENNPFPQLGRKVAELESGKAFGEQALFKEGGFRNASVYTLEQSSFLVIWRDKFLGVLSVLEQIKQDKIQRIGNVLPFFNDIVSSQLKDRLVYLFEDVSISKGTILTQENVKGSYIYILRSGRVALEKSITLEEYKEKESQSVRKQTFQHRFSEFTTAELIGDEILEEKSKIYFHKKNLKPSEYLFTSIVLSSDSQFLRLDKKKVIDGFPKYIVEKLRENMLIKKKMRVKIIEDYVQRIQPNFVEYQKKDINMKKSLVKKFKISNNIVGHLLGENTPLSSSSSPSKKVQFQNIVRNSILPLYKNQINYSLEANKTLIQDLQVIKLKKQKSNQFKKDADTPTQQDGQKSYLFQLNNEEKSLGINDKQGQQLNSASFSNNFTKRQQNQKEDNSYTDNQHGSVTSRSQFSKSKVTNNQSISLVDNGLQESQNYILPNGYSSFTNINNQVKNNLNGSVNDIQNEYFSQGIDKNQKHVKLRLSQSIPSLTNVVRTVNSELKPNPNFFYNHAEKLQKQKVLSQEEENKLKQKNSNNPSKIMQVQQEKQKVEPLTEEQNRKIQNYKNSHISQISKKIDCDIMKKEIIYQHMTSLKEQKLINPFEDQNAKRQKQIQKEIQGVIQKVQKYSQEIQSHPNSQTTKIKKAEENRGPNLSLKPIQETKQEELTSKQFINISNQNVTQGSVSLSEFSNETVTQSIKFNTKPDSKKIVKFQAEAEKTEIPSTIQSQTERNKSSQRLESYLLLQDTESTNNHEHGSSSSGSHDSNEDIDPIQKKLSVLQGKHKKKFYMLQETWDLGVENLKMKELDLRNDLQRKGIIHKPPLEQTNKDQFEKLDQHQLKMFKKYMKKKTKQLQKEKQQINNLFRMIQPEIKGQETYNQSEMKSKLNLDLQILQQLGQSNTQQSISSIKTITERTVNENNQNQNSEYMQNSQQKTNDHIQQQSSPQLNFINGNDSNNFSIQQMKPNQNAQAKQKQNSQVSISTVQLSLPQISPSKKLSHKYIISQNQIGDNFNINNSSYKAKTEGDLELEQIRISSEKVRYNKLINSPDKKQSSSIILELSPLLARLQISQSSTNLSQSISNPQKQVIANTERQSKDQQSQKAAILNQQLPNIVYNNINSYKTRPNQEIQILQNKTKQLKQMQQIEFTKKELQKISSSSSMISPNRHQNEGLKQQLFLSPQSAKLLQKI
ncbi:JmjC domain protein (macronuclear) [Tetrahymena thermophila SB210]|uniref:JmjC domain protein n=1 Tax=Tetrahymena thermophila (strain SB210) TaxID=312017 RepID=I7MAR9_TETTS|nr:JmjC domain protein [Tetrahymena thermophila SB210]EAS05963.2 JmjC domain protein [Tetrahymena thermophila SB210]|eukprot:XP_001026208.2 JmjC domain protein [Tetrahymena thermophila SB210]